MSEAIRLFGTDAPPAPSERITVGRLSFTLEEGALRHIRVGDDEIIRSIAFVVRDRDWGTLSPRLSVQSRETNKENLSLHLNAVFESTDASLDVSIFIDAGADSLTMRAEGMPKGDFETNRTGFTVLHPAGLAGCPVSITHSDGSVEASAFPTLIDPWQPFMDIVAMTHRANGLKVSCAFEGDTFETEDQRQWGDASYKTYVRPLALPWPYILKSEEPVSQSVSIHWSEAVSKAREPLDANSPDKMIFPETAIMINPQDVDRLLVHPEDLAQVSPQRLLCHLDTTTGRIPEQIGAFARLQKAMPTLIFDLELVCGFIQTPATGLRLAIMPPSGGGSPRQYRALQRFPSRRWHGHVLSGTEPQTPTGRDVELRVPRPMPNCSCRR